MEEIDRLESELKLMLDNIERIKTFVGEYSESPSSWCPTSSNVMGELKHRAVALKQRLTLISHVTSSNLFKL